MPPPSSRAAPAALRLLGERGFAAGKAALTSKSRDPIQEKKKIYIYSNQSRGNECKPNPSSLSSSLLFLKPDSLQPGTLLQQVMQLGAACSNQGQPSPALGAAN